MATIESHGCPGYTLWRLTGELDAFAAGLIRQAAGDLAVGSRLLIDLSVVSFMDQAGLTALIGAVRRIRDLRGSIAMACTRARLMAALKIAGLPDVVLVTDDLDEAATSITTGQTAREARCVEPGRSTTTEL